MCRGSSRAAKLLGLTPRSLTYSLGVVSQHGPGGTLTEEQAETWRPRDYWDPPTMCQGLHEYHLIESSLNLCFTDSSQKTICSCDESLLQELEQPGFKARLPLPNCGRFRKLYSPSEPGRSKWASTHMHNTST